MRTTSGTLPTDYTFTGQKLDASSGLMYYGARYYDTAIGRFAQPDSLIPDLYNPQSLNRYSYVLNNPLRYTDPTGHAYCDDHVCPGDDDTTEPPGSAGGTYSGVYDETGSDAGPDGDPPVETGGHQAPAGLDPYGQTGRRKQSKSYLPFDGTLAVGGQGNLNLFLLAIQVSIYPMLDTRGNVALVFAPAAGPGAGFGAAGGVTIQGTNAQDVDSLLSQVTNYVGISGGLGEVIGVDFMAAKEIGGLAVFIGTGGKDLFPTEVPVEVHWTFSPSFPILRARYDFWNQDNQ